MNKYKRGDYNEDGTKRFWGRHPSGKLMWMDPERFNDARELTNLLCRVAKSSDTVLEELRADRRAETGRRAYESHKPAPKPTKPRKKK
jgi:hypothetical protein